MLRAGVIGLGAMGRAHARVLAALPGVDLVAIADPFGDPLNAQGRPVVNSVDELLNIGVDYCVVSVPSIFHRSVALILAEAGVHALIEKPLSLDVSSSIDIVEAFESRGVVAAVGHIERYNPALQQARERLANGDLGDVYQVATRRQGPFPPRIADIGVVMDLATHDIDLTAWVSGQTYQTVSAQTAHRAGRDHEDLVTISARLSGGIIANHLINWVSPMKERVTVITGERGAFVADSLTADLWFHANGSVETVWDTVAGFRGVTEGDMVRFAFPKQEPLRVEHEAFRDAVLGTGNAIVTLREGLATIGVAEACLASAGQGGTLVRVGD